MVTARIKDCESNPCPKATPHDDVLWQALRGRVVHLIRAVGPKSILRAHRCNSDTFWQVAASDVPDVCMKLADKLDADFCCLCRHVLDIGD